MPVLFFDPVLIPEYKTMLFVRSKLSAEYKKFHSQETFSSRKLKRTRPHWILSDDTIEGIIEKMRTTQTFLLTLLILTVDVNTCFCIRRHSMKQITREM